MGLFEEPALRGECTEKPMVLLLLLCTLAISAQDDVLDLVVRGRQRPSLERGGQGRRGEEKGREKGRGGWGSTLAYNTLGFAPQKVHSLNPSARSNTERD